jgi:hypothetical protein
LRGHYAKNLTQRAQRTQRRQERELRLTFVAASG